MDFYHALNRGTDKRTIFYDSQDYARFVHNLYSLNDTEPVFNLGRDMRRMSDLVGRSFDERSGRRLVDVHGWCLMRNHFHLLLTERENKGISKFLMKVNVGYAKYFNEKYERSGTLFQGRTKKVHIQTDAQYLHILNYIHLNPLDYLRGASAWREYRIASTTSSMSYLDKYRWSSYLDYCSIPNFPSLLTTKEFADPEYRKKLAKYLGSLQRDDLSRLTLE